MRKIDEGGTGGAPPDTRSSMKSAQYDRVRPRLAFGSPFGPAALVGRVLCPPVKDPS